MSSSGFARRLHRLRRPLHVERLERRVVPSFVAPQAFDVGGLAMGVAVGDFNGDGVPDLAVADDRSVSVLLGRGDGSFQPARIFSAGLSPAAVAVGDFNGDGRLDLAVTTQTGVSVLLGNGDGSFQPPRFLVGGGRGFISSVAVGDFNGDGFLDIVATHADGLIDVFLGNGDGSFRVSDNLLNNEPTSVAVADLNDDGRPDLVVTDNGGGEVHIFLGNGDGLFQEAGRYRAGPSQASSVAVGDFNGDGIPDLAVTSIAGVSVFLGYGDGSFHDALPFGAGRRPSSVAVGDVNGDGFLDLVVTNADDNTVSVLLGNGDGSFQTARNSSTGAQPTSVALADFNRDGRLDLAAADGADYTVSVLLGNGDGSFDSAPHFAAGPGPESVAVGDFNGDGIPDLAVANLAGVSVLLGNGDGSFQPARTFSAGNDPLAVAVGDFNGDGVLDLVEANYGSDDVTVLLGNGDGSFQGARNFPAGSRPDSVAVGDFDGDGVPDIVVANANRSGNGAASVLLGNGDGLFQAPRTFGASYNPTSVMVADLNRDGALDLVVSGSTVSVLLGNGDGSFQAWRAVAPGTAAVGDFNGDGIPDLAVAADGNGTVGVLLGNGDGSFQLPRTYFVGQDVRSVAVGDFNRDGLLDVVAMGSTLRVLLGNGDSSLQVAPVSYIAGSFPMAAVVADFNRDGWPDLAVANHGTNDVSILPNDRHWKPRLPPPSSLPLPPAVGSAGAVVEGLPGGPAVCGAGGRLAVGPLRRRAMVSRAVIWRDMKQGAGCRATASPEGRRAAESSPGPAKGPRRRTKRLKAASDCAVDVRYCRGNRLDEQGSKNRARFCFEVRSALASWQPLQTVEQFLCWAGTMNEVQAASRLDKGALMTTVATPAGDANKDADTAERPTTVLLVDDQAIVGESVRRMLAAEADIQFHFCQDPLQAIQTANAVQPTVILQDLVMPAIDGLQLVKFFRANLATRDTPMIVLSSKEEPLIKAQAFARGANDYLVKLPDKVELIARIRYHSRGYIHLLERNEAYRRLEENQRQLADELAQAARYVESLLPPRRDGEVRVDSRFVPSTQLGGDMFGYHWLDRDHLALYLLDVSGHGVGSSLLAVSVANLLGAQSLPNTDCRDPGKVLGRLNDIFPMEKQHGKYFTIWYGVLDRARRTLTYSNAGHPPALLYTGPSAARASLQKLESCGFAAGMIEGTAYDSRTVELGPFARVLLYSDGVYEIDRPDGPMWTMKEFIDFVSGLPCDAPWADQILAHVRRLHGLDILADDFSVVELRC
jgi:sigma-B regulation protein RsbU (phosphoserine phosphatase)